MQDAKHLPSRRNFLSSIVAAPTLAVAPPTTGRAEDIDATAATAKAALKDARGTKFYWARVQARFQVLRAACPQI